MESGCTWQIIFGLQDESVIRNLLSERELNISNATKIALVLDMVKRECYEINVEPSPNPTVNHVKILKLVNQLICQMRKILKVISRPVLAVGGKLIILLVSSKGRGSVSCAITLNTFQNTIKVRSLILAATKKPTTMTHIHVTTWAKMGFQTWNAWPGGQIRPSAPYSWEDKSKYCQLKSTRQFWK